jgi:hydroxyacylglutathione hydrolase
MKRINRDGPRILGEHGDPARLPDARLGRILDAGGIVVDTRPADDYAAGHVPGTLSLPLTRAFTTWAGWLVPYDTDFHLVGDRDAVDEAVRDLAMIGLDRVAGVFGPGAVDARPYHDLSRIDRIDTRRLADRRRRNEVSVLDIRGAAEWEAVRIPGATHIPLGYLGDRLDELPERRPVVVHCESGGRSAIAASVLEAAGVEVIDYPAGIRGWIADGEPAERGRPEEDAEPVAA